MAEKLGQNYQLFVNDGAGAYNAIQGQTGLTRDGSTTLINQSSKTTGKYDLQAPGRSNLTITCPGVVTLPDANGLERVHTLDKAHPQVPETFQIREDPYASDDVIFEASCYVSNFTRDDPDQDNATYSFQLTLAANPTVNLLKPA